MSLLNQVVQQQVSRVRSDAQTSLPFTPNNGNPNGANNMRNARPEDMQRQGGQYSWLQPSDSMSQVNQMITKPLMLPNPEPTPMPKPYMSSGADVIPMPKPIMVGPNSPYPYGADGIEPGMIASPTNNYNNQKPPYPVLSVNGGPTMGIPARMGNEDMYARPNMGQRRGFGDNMRVNFFNNRRRNIPVIPTKPMPIDTVNPGKPTVPGFY